MNLVVKCDYYSYMACKLKFIHHHRTKNFCTSPICFTQPSHPVAANARRKIVEIKLIQLKFKSISETTIYHYFKDCFNTFHCFLSITTFIIDILLFSIDFLRLIPYINFTFFCLWLNCWLENILRAN